MKTCPICKTLYSDDTLNFCLEDGALLSDGSMPTEYLSNESADSPETEILMRVANARNLTSNQDKPDTAPSFAPTLPDVSQKTSANPLPAASNKKYLAIIAATLCLGILGGLLIAFSLSKRTNGTNAATNYNSGVYSLTNSANNLGNYTSTDTANNAFSNFSSNFANNFNSAETNRTNASNFSLDGTWKGTFGSAFTPSTLNIQHDGGANFSATLSREDGAVIAITGEINYEKLTVSMKETEIIKQPKNGFWSLGKNTGEISKDGKTMKGRGSDSDPNATYPWSFTKK